MLISCTRLGLGAAVRGWSERCDWVDCETCAGRTQPAAPRFSVGQVPAGVWRLVGEGGRWRIQER